VTGKGPAVLIVDDEPDVCWALERILNASGILSVVTTSAHEALRLVRRERFLLALVDAKLPDGEGLELARRIREAAPGLRTVLISGYYYTDDSVVVEALAGGVIDGFVSKPFQHAEIRKLTRDAGGPG
jgi:DNA-binding NtrC family response regulator